MGGIIAHCDIHLLHETTFNKVEFQSGCWYYIIQQTHQTHQTSANALKIKDENMKSPSKRNGAMLHLRLRKVLVFAVFAVLTAGARAMRS
jgi:hypothetical protein